MQNCKGLLRMAPNYWHKRDGRRRRRRRLICTARHNTSVSNVKRHNVLIIHYYLSSSIVARQDKLPNHSCKVNRQTDNDNNNRQAIEEGIKTILPAITAISSCTE